MELTQKIEVIVITVDLFFTAHLQILTTHGIILCLITQTGKSMETFYLCALEMTTQEAQEIIIIFTATTTHSLDEF